MKLRENYASCVSQLLAEAAEEYEVGSMMMTCLVFTICLQASLRIGTVNMLVRNPEEEKKEKEKVK